MKSSGLVLDVDAAAIESGIDRSRYHHTLSETDTLTTRGKFGKGTLFNGTTSFVDCGNDRSLNFGDGSSDSPFTVEAFVKMIDATGFSVIGKTGLSWNDKGVWDFYVHTTNTLRILIYDNSASAYLIRYYNADLSVYENQWIHLSATYNGGGSVTDLQLYLNGVRVDDSSATDGTYVAMEALTETAEIGRLGTFHYANGTIDKVRIYNYALSATQIKRHYLEKAYLYVPHPVRIP